MATPGNPLLGSWPSTAGTNQPPPSVPGAPTTGGTPGMPGGAPLPPGPAGTPGSTNPYGMGSLGGGALGANLGESNLQSQTYKNSLMPLFSQMMFSAGGSAENFFKMLTDLGSPFYKQKQAATTGQGAKQAQDAAGIARQEVNSTGAGYTPSGAGAAMFGGMGQAEAGNQAELFLNNLFQNEQLQAAGASGQAQIASLFNPSALTGQANPNINQSQNTGAEWLNAVGNLFPKSVSVGG